MFEENLGLTRTHNSSVIRSLMVVSVLKLRRVSFALSPYCL